MKFKGTAVLFVLLAALAGWVYLTDIRGREERDRAAEAASKALPVEADEIVQITLTYPDRTIQALRTAGAWEFVTPPNLEADSEEWDRLGANVGRVERGEVVSTNAGDLGSFGLGTPVLRMSVALSDGRTEEILFGAENPGGTDNYVKLASSDEVFLSPTTWLSLLRKELDDLRDKTLLRFEEASVDRIEISATGTTLRKEGESWLLVTPVQTAADNAEVQAFLGTLGSARATGFSDLDEAGTGLDRPSLRIVLHDAASDVDHTLLVGNAMGTDSSSYYAKDSSRDAVFLLEGSVIESARRSTFDWREKKIVALDSTAVTGIELVAQERFLEIQASGEDWVMGDGRQASPAEVMGMLNSLEFARAADIIDSAGPLGDYGLDTPPLQVALRGGGNDLIRFAFGAPLAEESQVYWKAEAEPEVKVVPITLFERFNVSADDIASDAREENLQETP